MSNPRLSQPTVALPELYDHSMTIIGQLANQTASDYLFADYLQRRSKRTAQTQLAALVLWVGYLRDVAAAVLLAAVLGTLLMVSTWSEIPLALQMLDQGLHGPAAAVLVALPAVNLASLWLIARSTGQWKLALGMGGAVMVSALGAGLMFNN